MSGFNSIVIDLQKITWREAPKFFRIVEGEIKILIRKFDVKCCKNPKKNSVFQEIPGSYFPLQDDLKSTTCHIEFSQFFFFFRKKHPLPWV